LTVLPLQKPVDALLVLEDGAVFEGSAICPGTCFGEVVFNTSMTGYQEILTDPSYRGQIVVMTFPHVGNYGVNPEFAESSRPWVEGFVARQFTSSTSSHDSEEDLPSYLRGHGVPAIHGVDTRAIVRRIRLQGALRGVLTSERSEVDLLVAELKDFPPMVGKALVDEVSCNEPFEVLLPPGIEARFHLAVYDFGVKANILRSLVGRRARLTVVPARTPRHVIQSLGVDGVVLSNGPGDPAPLTGIVEILRQLAEDEVPMFGICLGHQLLGLALGGRTFKLKFGHHGANQPVRDLESGKVLITSQNHGFAVAAESLPGNCRVSQVNLNDGTVEAFEVTGRTLVSAQYHPEAAPGPHDAAGLFDRFLALLATDLGGSR
jgi:carbamoyl-phosphate synthase small subunit